MHYSQAHVRTVQFSPLSSGFPPRSLQVSVFKTWLCPRQKNSCHRHYHKVQVVPFYLHGSPMTCNASPSPEGPVLSAPPPALQLPRVRPAIRLYPCSPWCTPLLNYETSTLQVQALYLFFKTFPNSSHFRDHSIFWSGLSPTVSATHSLING